MFFLFPSFLAPNSFESEIMTDDATVYFADHSIEIVVSAKKIKRSEYAEKYSGEAIRQMQEYGIPASITLAQGILESTHGRSYLATTSNNHFGIKCFHGCDNSNSINIKDDSDKDRFVRFETVLDSYEGHSIFLSENPRYNGLFEFESTDFYSWAHGLQLAGYATDRSYANKLINIIESYGLDRFDQ